MPDVNEWDQKPNGCADDEHWKECVRKGYIKRNSLCNHPENDYVDNRDGYPICRHHSNAVRKKIYDQRSSK